MTSISPYIAQEIDREFRTAVAYGAATADEVRMARALFDVNAIEARPANVAHALGAAARLIDQGILRHQVRTLYGNGYGCHKLVNKAVEAAR